ncbi:MAG TPA: tail fiber domain-containing protein [Thermoanaerobaculia bacterium]|nr:tail fiber domain-containing protein [Thermoanaerobaculia bacterium]
MLPLPRRSWRARWVPREIPTDRVAARTDSTAPAAHPPRPVGSNALNSNTSFKEGIEELGAVGERLAELRPVTFRYRPGLVDGETAPQVGLIAEEVAELFPELVTRDREGSPYGVRYDLLSVLLLDEVQELRARLGVLEAGEAPVAPQKSWWRRVAFGGRDSP